MRVLLNLLFLLMTTTVYVDNVAIYKRTYTVEKYNCKCNAKNIKRTFFHQVRIRQPPGHSSHPQALFLHRQQDKRERRVPQSRPLALALRTGTESDLWRTKENILDFNAWGRASNLLKIWSNQLQDMDSTYWPLFTYVYGRQIPIFCYPSARNKNKND